MYLRPKPKVQQPFIEVPVLVKALNKKTAVHLQRFTSNRPLHVTILIVYQCNSKKMLELHDTPLVQSI